MKKPQALLQGAFFYLAPQPELEPGTYVFTDKSAF